MKNNICAGTTKHNYKSRESFEVEAVILTHRFHFTSTKNIECHKWHIDCYSSPRLICWFEPAKLIPTLLVCQYLLQPPMASVKSSWAATQQLPHNTKGTHIPMLITSCFFTSPGDQSKRKQSFHLFIKPACLPPLSSKRPYLQWNATVRL
jgi:hypothetical protein